jgi:hypothetical protein
LQREFHLFPPHPLQSTPCRLGELRRDIMRHCRHNIPTTHFDLCYWPTPNPRLRVVASQSHRYKVRGERRAADPLSGLTDTGHVMIAAKYPFSAAMPTPLGQPSFSRRSSSGSGIAAAVAGLAGAVHAATPVVRSRAAAVPSLIARSTALLVICWAPSVLWRFSAVSRDVTVDLVSAGAMFRRKKAVGQHVSKPSISPS